MSDDNQRSSLAYGNPLWNYGGAITRLTDPQSLITQIEMYLRNVRRSEDGTKLISLGKARVNETGINDILGMISSISNQSQILSNFEQQEVEGMLDLLNDTLCRVMLVNKVKWGISCDADCDLINQQIISIAYGTLKRAYIEGERKFWKGSVIEQKITTESQERSGGLFNKFNPFAKKN